MTGKSPPPASIVCNRTTQLSILAVLWCGAVGCSVFSPWTSSTADYETARAEINDPSNTFRPEGVSAERDYYAAGFLDRIGIRAKRRRNVETARSHYERGEELFNEAKSLTGSERPAQFRKAAAQYQLAAENWQSSGLEQNALMMSAESYFFAEDYVAAEEKYAALVKEYPRNPFLDKIDSRRFEIADYWLEYDKAKPSPFVYVNLTDKKRPLNDTVGHGKRVIEAIRLDNPTGDRGDDATMRLAMHHLDEDRFEEAADAFADLVLTYPDSEHQFNAQFLEAQCLLASYQGPSYSSIPITKASKRIDQIRRQFPQQAQERSDELQEAWAKVRYAQAERIWKQAAYRRKQSENASARFHYERILKDFSDTPFAEQARDALEQIAEAPDHPKQRFQALIWMLGGTADDRPWRDQAGQDSDG